MRCFGALAFIASCVAVFAQPVRAQEVRWDVWVDTQHCSDTRSSWLAVAKELPGFGWTPMPGAPTATTFMEAIANMDAMRISGPFDRHCCKFVLWRDSASGVQALVRENDVAGAGWMPDSTPMCAETAILQAGIADPIGALTLPLGSVPGASVAVTAGGIVAAGSAAVSIPTNPPTVVSPSPSVNTIGDITGETGGPATPGGGSLPDGMVALVEGAFTLACERVDMPASTYEGYMILYFAPGGAIGPGTVTLVDPKAGQLDFDMQTQLMGSDVGALGTVQDPGQGIGRVEVTVIGKLTGATTGTVPASADIKASIGMKARFANGRTPGDGTCTGHFGA